MLRVFIFSIIFLFVNLSSFGQTDSLIGIIDNKLVYINKNNGNWQVKCEINGIPAQYQPQRFSFSQKSNVFYGFTNYPDGAYLYRLTLDGTFTTMGKLSSTVGTFYFAETISVNRKNQKVYIGASINGSIASGDYYSEVILEIDTNTLTCTPSYYLNTPIVQYPDADLMAFDDNDNLFFIDGIPQSNRNYF